jgi:colanic acid biosynthesis glycosyl transferase WcaI
MKILINDHSGHSFTLSLSKELANHHCVLHCFSKNFQSPKGYLTKLSTDPPNLFFYPLVYKNKFRKYTLFLRALQERKYAGMLNKIIASEKPDIVICVNTPLIAQQRILSFCKKQKIPFIFWCQDLYSVAIKNIAFKKLGFLGYFVAKPFDLLEKYQLRHANCIISITEDFGHQFKRWEIQTPNFIIPNWSPIQEYQFVNKNNELSQRFVLEDTFNIIYSGTLGFKHNPQLIVDLCTRLAHHKDIRIVVVSEGLGASYLQKEKNRLNLSNLVLIPFQPFEKFSSILSTADIFMALLETDAGLYSVPSKILSYLCAGKPIIVAAPVNNLASKIIKSSNSGRCIENNNCDDLVTSVLAIKENKNLHQLLSKNARKYAEQNFEVEKIAKLFTDIIQKAV